MSFAIKFGKDVSVSSSGESSDSGLSSGLIYFDAVTGFNRGYEVQLTKHPIAYGGEISDHVISQNPKFQLSAVVSGVDVTLWTSLIRDEEGKSLFNYYSGPETKIEDNDGFSLLPESVSQFFIREAPDVIMDDLRTDLTDQVEAMLIRLMEGFIYEDRPNKSGSESSGESLTRSKIQMVDLLEFDGIVVKRTHSDLVITSLQFKEDLNSGDGLIFDITLEKPKFVGLLKDKLPRDIVVSLKDSATGKAKKSKADGTSKEIDGEYGDDTDNRPRGSDEAFRRTHGVGKIPESEFPLESDTP